MKRKKKELYLLQKRQLRVELESLAAITSRPPLGDGVSQASGSKFVTARVKVPLAVLTSTTRTVRIPGWILMTLAKDLHFMGIWLCVLRGLVVYRCNFL
ncbi:hypothetical protein TNIN_387001 [Trichonephila inaurata madagascariensis]|uniref:Uncharacterized protein n=1 Tax=Trichonephila inaurata madagascariensis TaxID=2747483 RepID=A0A8X7CAU9_9ARAC|nr:hypothetical protein TNIN_386991 [Trichonephila inaurata madagascariensis]GFY59627.1 hypothetical protein TNIN_387001 [Trichonephila inaurata madagascariensis]